MDKSLAAWKNASGKKPLVLFGARQTDKTTSVLDFAKREYQHLVFVDFYRQPEMKAAFTASREPQAIIMALGAPSVSTSHPRAPFCSLMKSKIVMMRSPCSSTFALTLRNTM